MRAFDVPDRRPSPSTVASPDTRFTSYVEGNLFRVSVPANWKELPGNNSVTFAPEGVRWRVRFNLEAVAPAPAFKIPEN